MMVVFGILFLVFNGKITRAVAKSARASAERQEFVIEAMKSLRALKYTNSTKIWMDRYRASSAKAAIAGYETARINALISAISQFVMAVPEPATLVLMLLAIPAILLRRHPI